MKKVVLYLIFCCTMQMQGKKCIPNTFDRAKQYFDQLSTQEMQGIDLTALTNIQFEAFKNLSKELFHTEVASHSCSSPANRTKAEIMMQKVGVYY